MRKMAGLPIKGVGTQTTRKPAATNVPTERNRARGRNVCNARPGAACCAPTKKRLKSR
jgi:hypothetical protein